MQIINLRDTLPLNRLWDGREIGYRAETRYITLHYNGGPRFEVPPHRQYGAGLLEHLRMARDWHSRPGAFGVPIGADGIQYHFAVGSDGSVYQMRNDLCILWHCGHEVGNTQSYSIHLPLGGNQEPSDAMWDATIELVRHLGGGSTIPRSRVLGHLEWSATACPGTPIMERIAAYRNTATVPRKKHQTGEHIIIWPATVRTDHTVNGREVLTLSRGHRVFIDAWLDSKDTDGRGVGKWGHWVTGLGFIHESALEKAE